MVTGFHLAAAFGLLVVLVVLAAWVAVRQPLWAHPAYWKAEMWDNPEDIWRRSGGGGLDRPARLALKRARQRLQSPRIQGVERARNHSNVARFLTYAVYLPQRDAAQGDRAPREEDTLPAAFGEERFRPTWELIVNNQRAIVESLQQGGALLAPDPEVDAVLGQANELAQVIGGGASPQVGEAMQARAEARRARATQKNPSPAGGAGLAAGDAFLAESIRHTDDFENSHDTAVSAGLRGVVALLEADPDTARRADALTLDAIAAELEAAGPSLSRDPRTGNPRLLLVTEKALPALRLSEETAPLSCADTTLGRVARLVWARAAHPSNAANAQKLRQAYFDALVDSWKPGIVSPIPVCGHGRAGRLLSSLATLDFDENTWHLARREDLNNELVEAAKAARAAAAKNALAAPEPGRRAAAAEYLAQTVDELKEAARRYGEPSPEEDESLRVHLAAAIEAGVRKKADELNSRLPGVCPPEALERLIDELKLAA